VGWFVERSSNHVVESFNLSVCRYSFRSVIGSVGLLVVCLLGGMVGSFICRLVGQSVVGSIVWCAPYLFGWLCPLVGRSQGYWWVGLVKLSVCQSGSRLFGGWMVGQWVNWFLVRLLGGTLGRYNGR
jgi:hypothetical protein